jgi:uncharacterized protein YcaQ
MSRDPLRTTLESARRLTVTRQHLAGRLAPKPSRSAILSVVRDVAFVQWDPVNVVAPSHLLSLWSRLGDFRRSDLERLLWQEKKLFEHWTPAASLVLTEDYPLYHSLMGRYPESLSTSWGKQRERAKKFLAENAELRKKLLKQLRKGPLQSSQLEDLPGTKRSGEGWSFGSDASLMLFHLVMSGDVMVVGHEGTRNIWGLSEGFLPGWSERRPLSEEDAEREAAQRAIRALGTATPSEINFYFVRGRYQNLRATLARLEEESAIHRIHVEALDEREARYIHRRDVALLGSLSGSDWEPRMSLLPPFDNMLGNSARTSRLFGFDYVREQFLPKEKRRFGTYVLPILWGEKFVGRIDPRLDSRSGELVINAVHAEEGATEDPALASEIAGTIARLATFVGARKVIYTSRVPRAWKSELR